MARINLLPWREELRTQQRLDFIKGIVLAVVVTLGILGYIYSHYEGAITDQKARNKFLATQNSLLDKKIQEIKELEAKESNLLSKMKVIQNLQGSRPEIVHLFSEIAKTVPDGVFLTKFTQAGNRLTFDGKAQSNARVSAYMKNIEASSWMGKPRLNIIQTTGKARQGRVSRFTLITNQSRPLKKKDKDKDKKGGAGS